MKVRKHTNNPIYLFVTIYHLPYRVYSLIELRTVHVVPNTLIDFWVHLGDLISEKMWDADTMSLIVFRV